MCSSYTTPPSRLRPGPSPPWVDFAYKALHNKEFVYKALHDIDTLHTFFIIYCFIICKLLTIPYYVLLYMHISDYSVLLTLFFICILLTILYYFLFICRPGGGGVYEYRSYDLGDTWSPPRCLTISALGPVFAPGPSFLPGTVCTTVRVWCCSRAQVPCPV